VTQFLPRRQNLICSGTDLCHAPTTSSSTTSDFCPSSESDQLLCFRADSWRSGRRTIAATAPGQRRGGYPRWANPCGVGPWQVAPLSSRIKYPLCTTLSPYVLTTVLSQAITYVQLVAYILVSKDSTPHSENTSLLHNKIQATATVLSESY
jgi:hypothetical protein